MLLLSLYVETLGSVSSEKISVTPQTVYRVFDAISRYKGNPSQEAPYVRTAQWPKHHCSIGI